MSSRDMPVLGPEFSETPPSIFNDVIGPVMRGPSSSHCAAAVRIGRMARDLMGGQIERVLMEFHPDGSLATTHESQGSDMGFFGGLLGWEADHERLVESAAALSEAGIRCETRISEFPAFHPNTYRITLWGGGEEHGLVALSTGGGAIKVIEVDGVALSMAGDFHETLLFLAGVGPENPKLQDLAERIRVEMPADRIRTFALVQPGEADNEEGDRGASVPQGTLVQISAQAFASQGILSEVASQFPQMGVRKLGPVLPVGSRADMEVPFLSARGLEEWNGDRELQLWELAALYESSRGGFSQEEVLSRMIGVLEIMEGSVQEGLAGTEYSDRILPAQSGAFREKLEAGELVDAGVLNSILLYVSAIMEVKSSMGVVVAAPTAGSCGALAGTILGAGHGAGRSTEEMAKAMLAAGLVGVFIAAGSTFAAEVCGCQAECGAGSGMAAAGLVCMSGGSAERALAAASMALQNTLGMICDPVANRVEVPCLGRNALAASNALASANMALAGFDQVISLDEVISVMDEVGKSLPHQLRCTALGGLSVTETSKRIEERLKG